ncbi:MAG: bacterial Ig-like domain-containing protein [Bacilli bacterium]
MKLKTKIWTSLLIGSFLTLALLFSSVNFTKSKLVNEVFASSPQTITITGAAFSTTDTNQTATFDDYEFKGKVKQFDSTAIWFTSGSGYLYNTTDLGSITKMTLSYKIGGSAAAVQRFNFGNSSLTSFMSSGGKTVSTSTGGQTYEETGGVGYGFFNISVSNKNLQLNSLVIDFIPKSSAVLQDIEVSGTPTKTSYFVGDSFDPTGLTVKANYDDGSDKDVTDKCVFTPNLLTLGTTDILVSYTEEEIEETYLLENIISVTERHLESLQITTNPAKMSYFVGDSFDPTGMVIKAKYDLGPDIEDYKGYDYSPKSAFASVGSKTITITDLIDDNISTTLSVQVSEVPPITELFISEYIEGSSSNRGLEIYNGTGSSISLSGYSIKQYTDGSSSYGSAVATLSGTIANDSTYTIVNHSATNELKSKANLLNSVVTSFTGNDAIGLFKSDVLIDLIGIIGNEPGKTTGWTGDAANGPGSTLDKTLVRTSTTFGPNTSFTWSEWNCYPADTFTYFGSHTVELGAPSVNEEAIAYAEMFLDDTADSCAAQSLSGLEAIWGDFKEVYEDVLSDEAKDYFASLTPNEEGSVAEHALARYLFIITKYKTLDNFMVDSQGVLIFNVNLADHVSTVNYPKIIAIITVLLSLTLVSGTYLIVRRKHKYN